MLTDQIDFQSLLHSLYFFKKKKRIPEIYQMYYQDHSLRAMIHPCS